MSLGPVAVQGYAAQGSPATGEALGAVTREAHGITALPLCQDSEALQVLSYGRQKV
jgi:hypothetical protein